MEIIAHRCNSIKKLIETPKRLGVEVDIRSYGADLIIHHDPFEKGVLFEDWLKNFSHETLILNVKEEGLEEKLIYLMESKGINKYFFLDQSFPFLLKYKNLCAGRCAVRLSEFEAIQTVLNLSGQVNWVWVDSFSSFPIGKSELIDLKEANFKICIVSPELQGKEPEVEIPRLKELLQSFDITIEAVCTKRYDIWE